MHFPTSIRTIGLTRTRIGKAFLYMMVVLSLLPTLSLRRGRTMMSTSTIVVWQINDIKLFVCPRIALWWVDAVSSANTRYEVLCSLAILLEITANLYVHKLEIRHSKRGQARRQRRQRRQRKQATERPNRLRSQ
jgi:hypothetical protein